MRRKSLGTIFPSVTHFESVPSKRSKAPAVCPSRGPRGPFPCPGLRRVRVIESSAPGSRPSQCGHLLGPAVTGGCDQNISGHRARAAGLSSAPTGARDRRPQLHNKRPPAEEAPGREPWEHLRPSAWSFAALERLVPVHSARGTRSSQNSLGRCHVPRGAGGGCVSPPWTLSARDVVGTRRARTTGGLHAGEAEDPAGGVTGEPGEPCRDTSPSGGTASTPAAASSHPASPIPATG